MMKKRNKLKLKILSFLCLLSICLMTLFACKTYAYDNVDIQGTRNFLSETNMDINDSLYPIIDNSNFYSWYAFEVDSEDIIGSYCSIYFYLNSEYRIVDSTSSYRYLNIGVYFADDDYSNTYDVYSSCSNWYRIDDLLSYGSGRVSIQYLYGGIARYHFYVIFEYRRIADGYLNFTSNDFIYTNAMGNRIIDTNNQIYKDEIAFLNESIVTMQNSIDNLNTLINQQNGKISSLQFANNQLQDQIAAYEDNVSFPNLIWLIAGSPWESFKNIWNVNVLGLNISGFITGLITSLVVIWIVKKLWK